MANTYSWNCKTVDCYPTFDDETDVVYNVHWRLTATSSKKDGEGNPYTASSMEHKLSQQMILKTSYLSQI